MPTVHSRIAGTGGYLPAQVLTNDDLAQRIDTSDEWIRARTGIRAAAHRRARRKTTPTSRCTRRAWRSPRPESRARRRRPHHRRDDHAGHDLSVDRVHPAGQARRDRRPGVRRAGGVLAASSTRCRSPTGWSRPARVTQRAGGRRRNLLAHPRLERSRHLRAVRRRRRRGRARAVARHPASSSSHLHADGSHRDILCVPGTGCEWRGHGHAVPAHGRPGGVQVRGEGAGRSGRTKRWPPTSMERDRPSTG